MTSRSFAPLVGNEPPGGLLLAEPSASSDLELLPEVRRELLDPEGWRDVLERYAHTTKLAVALTNADGHMVGTCHNAQKIWSLVRQATPERDAGCSFCLAPHPPCGAVPEALRTGRVAMARDFAGLTHVAAPLTLGNGQLGALIAGQAFDQYPDPLRLQRVAREFGVSSQQLWDEAIRKPPVSGVTLCVYGDLLASLGQAVLRQRYAAIVERKLLKTNWRFRTLIDGVKEYALTTMDLTGRVTSWNSGAERLLGYTEAEILGQDFSCFFTPQDLRNGVPQSLLQKIEQEGRVEDESWQVRKDGTSFFASAVAAKLGEGDAREFVRLIRDVTESRKAEEALRKFQKMESIGILASGIAHDFNNLLTGILGGVSCAKSVLALDHPAHPMLSIAERSSERAAELTSQLLAYAGKGKYVITRLDLSALISEMLRLIETSISKTVQLHLDIAPDLPWIEADASQIRQIVMNLAINAAESIDPQGGTVRLSTGVTDLQAQDESKPGRYVYLEVADAGSGMSETTKAQMFEPFFTTKFLGRGLGLAAVAGIVGGHHGKMQVESAVGDGTTFRIYFPAVEASFPEPEKGSVATDSQDTGTILVIDDEPLMREIARVILEECGYSVLLAENGQEGVNLFSANADTIGAVLLDMTMPVMDGKQALRLIREIRPSVPVILSTGYSEMNARDQVGPGAAEEFIQKPYTATQLREKIKTSLQHPRNQ
jgi:PAS domain S-box-containing protein